MNRNGIEFCHVLAIKSKHQHPACIQGLLFTNGTALLHACTRIKNPLAGRCCEDLGKLCKGGHLVEAVQAVENARQPVSIRIAHILLQNCANKEHLRLVQSLVLYGGFYSNEFLGFHFIRLSALHGSLLDANQVFDNVVSPCAQTWSAIILANAKLREAENALELYHAMQISTLRTNKHIYISSLRACVETSAISHGLLIHSRIINFRLQPDAMVGSSLVNMYAKCGSLKEALRVFNEFPKRDVVSWNAIISGYVQHSQGQSALKLFDTMEQEGISANKVTFLSTLKACSMIENLQKGRLLHEIVIDIGSLLDVEIGSALMDMYFNCGNIEEACNVFQSLPTRNVVSWNAMAMGYCQHGYFIYALDIFEIMQHEKVKPDKVTFLSILRSCSGIGDLTRARRFHHEILSSKIKLDISICNTLVDMYAKCGSLEEAHEVFDRMPNSDVISWNVMITGYAQHNYGIIALELFERMQQEQIKPEKVTFLGVIKACTSMGHKQKGRVMHNHVIQDGLIRDVFLRSALVDMYAKCRSLEEARYIFDSTPNQNVVMWNAMLIGYADDGDGSTVLDLVHEMQEKGIELEKVTFLGALKACRSIENTQEGRLLHSKLLSMGSMLDTTLVNTLIDMYSKCGSLVEAHTLFDKLQTHDVVSWGAIISGYVYHGEDLAALELFKQMQQKNLQPNTVIFSTVLKACGSIFAIDHGKTIHGQVIKHRLEADFVIGSALVDMYSKCARLEEARKIFDSLLNRDVVAWNAMVAAYAQHGQGLLAIDFFETMQKEGIEPEKVTYLSVLKACGSIGAIDYGRIIHEQVCKSGLLVDVMVGSTLVDMYAKCGNLGDARNTFDVLLNCNLISWNALLSGYAQIGNIHQAGQCFIDMQRKGYRLNETTFSSMLVACGRGGLVEEGRHYFRSMREEHYIKPDVHHYTCMVDLLSRAGCLKEAGGLLQAAAEPNVIGWTALLGACRMHGDIELARECFDKLIGLESCYAAGYVLMANIYADGLQVSRHTLY